MIVKSVSREEESVRRKRWKGKKNNTFPYFTKKVEYEDYGIEKHVCRCFQIGLKNSIRLFIDKFNAKYPFPSLVLTGCTYLSTQPSKLSSDCRHHLVV
ncbi:hypothetical protein TNIN_184581 [Trichonephila inaurata madagascariensis]|uniref:Uncharacterized protein n=1 Tax=Trichonephila inaurata madagascariensis TaxID=2747483 RepID=A0A8X7C251_9ARAC|nr:hypothetical protein TNIN_184581 [Trichonephila inaurata madagascariensis]